MWRIIWFLLGGLWSYINISAQNTGASAQELMPISDGLSQGMVFSVLQTSDNFLWVATKDGLNRYDGNRFEVYLPDPFNPFSIAASETRKLFEDNEGNLWIAYVGGMEVYLPKQGRFLHLNWANKQWFDGENVDFTQTPDGSIWVADKQFLWQLLQPQAAIQKALAQNQPNVTITVNHIKFNPVLQQKPNNGFGFNGVLYNKALGLVTATNEGMYRVEEDLLQLIPVHDTLPQTACNFIGQDKNGSLWVQWQLPNAYTNAANAKMPWYTEFDKECNIFVFSDNNKAPQVIIMPCATYSQFDYEGKLWQYSLNEVRTWQPENFLLGKMPEQTLRYKGAITQAQGYYHTAISIDRSGVVWLGTSGYGLLKGIAAKPKINQLSSRASMRQMYEDASGLVFFSLATNTAYQATQRFTPTANPWFVHYDKPDIFFFTATFDKDGNLWVNEANKPTPNSTKDSNLLLRIDAQTRQITQYIWAGADLVCLPNGNLLSVTQEGLHTINPATKQEAFYPFDKPQEFPYFNNAAAKTLFVGKNGEVWITDVVGFIHAKPIGQGFAFTYYQTNPQNRQSLSNNVVLCVAEDPLEPQRYLWIGTKGGLNKMDRQTGVFKHYKREQGLPDNVIYGILPDEHGHIWLSTNNGLCRFHVRTEIVHTFTTTDGLNSKEFNKASYLKTKTGHLLFGGVNGVAYFHPDSLQFNRRPPVVRITRLLVNNQLAQVKLPLQQPLNTQDTPVLLPADIPYAQQITLPYYQNLLTLEFAALDFNNPSQNQYKYQLLGLDPDWVELGNKNTVQFTNLKPGKYTFNVLGSNNDGTWADTPATLHIRILPPWWQTTWAYCLYFLFAGSAIYAGYRYQLRRQWEQQENHRLKELDDFKNRFFTNITHEFRTPLTVILGAGEELSADLSQGKDNTMPPPIASKLNLIQRSGENLLRLINQLLDLSKLESGNLQLKWVQGNIVPYLQYIVESLQSLANTQQITLQAQIQTTEIVMDYDPERILQIVYNLLSNAIKFTPVGGQVLLSIIAHNESDTPQLQLSVTDTGVGIPPKDLPYIFDRFYQAQNLTKAKTGGTGIGLALTQELVKAMGGHITVQSAPDAGATFTITLPITHKAQPAANEPFNTHFDLPPPITESIPPIETPVANETQPTLLLIEDNPDVAAYLSALLQQYYQVHSAYNGQNGIDLALQLIPDLIVSDVMMPQKDGFEVCEFLKNHEHTSHIPIVLLTAKADVQHRIAGLKKGADAYLAKPFHKEELLTTLSNLLELRRKMQIRFAASLMQVSKPDAISLPEDNTPDQPISPPLDIDFEHAFLKKLINILDQHLDNREFDIPELCRLSGISQAQLYRKIKALTNLSISGFIRRYRLEKGKILLETTQLSVSEIAYAVGFTSLGYFSKSFLEEFGFRPQALRK